MAPCSLNVLGKIVIPNWQWCRVFAKMCWFSELAWGYEFISNWWQLNFILTNRDSLCSMWAQLWEEELDVENRAQALEPWFLSLGSGSNSDQVSSFQFESYMKVQQHFVQRRKRFSKSRLPPPPEIFITYFLTRGRCNSITRIMHKVMCWKSAQDWRHHLWSRQPMFELTNEPI